MCLAPSISTRDGKVFSRSARPAVMACRRSQAMVGHVVSAWTFKQRSRCLARVCGIAADLFRAPRAAFRLCRAFGPGHDVVLLPDYSWRTGGMQAVARDPDSGALAGYRQPPRRRRRTGLGRSVMDTYFAADYAEARAKFLESAKAVDVQWKFDHR